MIENPKTAKDYVSNGIEVLNEKAPKNWAKNITNTNLFLEDINETLICQAVGVKDYWKAKRMLGVDYGMEYGFVPSFGSTTKDVHDLMAEWDRRIKELV